MMKNSWLFQEGKKINKCKKIIQFPKISKKSYLKADYKMNGITIRITNNSLIFYNHNLRLVIKKIRTILNKKNFKFPISTFWFLKILILVKIKETLKQNKNKILNNFKTNNLIIHLIINHLIMRIKKIKTWIRFKKIIKNNSKIKKKM